MIAPTRHCPADRFHRGRLLRFRQGRQSARGFSLVEVTIAVGLVATALLPLVALLSTTTRSEVLAGDRLNSSLVAAAVFDELTSSLPEPALIIDSPTGAQERLRILSGGSSTSDAGVCLLCGFDGRLIGQGSMEMYESGVKPNGQGDAAAERVAGAILLLNASAEGAERPGLVRVRLSVEYPPAAARGDRRREVFESLLSLPTGGDR